MQTLKLHCSLTIVFLEQKTGISFYIQAALVISSLFICDFAYMRLKIGHFSGAYPLIYSHHWSFYMQIRYMQAHFFGPYLLHITRATCTKNYAISFLI